MLGALSRRRFVGGGLATAGLSALGCGGAGRLGAFALAGGELLGTLPLVDADDPASGRRTGQGLDARRFTDLSAIAPAALVTPASAYYLRTGAPDGLAGAADWRIALDGRVEAPLGLTLADLGAPVDRGTFVMECSGNDTRVGFALMSAGVWRGVPIAALLGRVRRTAAATQVLVEGYDRFASPSVTSTPGASWIFPAGALEAAGAFLGTHLEGEPIDRDHGAPVRLYVPGFYGCACIKWVTRIAWVGADQPATEHMREFAQRTLQAGVPGLAREFILPVIDQAAMVIRVERWRVAGRVRHRIVGILWGGERPTDRLALRAGRGAAFVPVPVEPMTTNATWSLWSMAWDPPSPGRYELACRIDDPRVRQRRLDAGWYARTVVVT